MDAWVVVDARRVPGLAGQVAFGELGPESRRIDEASGGDVVGVGVHPVGREQPSRSGAADRAGEACPGGECGTEATVGKTEILAPLDPEYGGGCGGLGGADLRGSARRWFPVGEVENADAQPAGEHERDGAPHAELGIVWMGGDDEGIELGILGGGRGEGAG